MIVDVDHEQKKKMMMMMMMKKKNNNTVRFYNLVQSMKSRVRKTIWSRKLILWQEISILLNPKP
jgi:preprotein translocase subunit SecE